ncbi:MAG: hypothetical protein IJU69_06260 [Bacteroidales bacterium]|nr:hypothetical protein [Bacteroidales bacterium]
MKTRISMLIFAALSFFISCGKTEFPSGRNDSGIVPVEFQFGVDSIGQTKGFAGYGKEWIYEFTDRDTVYVIPSFQGNRQESEKLIHSSPNFKGNWKMWIQGSTFDFYYPAPLGRNGYVSLKNQNSGTGRYPLKGHCTIVQTNSLNSIILRPLGAGLRILVNEKRKVSLNARTEQGRFVVGIDSTGAAVLAPPEAKAEDCSIFSNDYSYEFRITVPAGIKLSFYDGETLLKTTREGGFSPGTWATITIGEEVPTQVQTLPATEVGTYNAIVRGKVITDDLSKISKVFFVFADSRERVIQKHWQASYEMEATLEEDGSFSCSRRMLDSKKTYYYAAYAYDSRNYNYLMGDVHSFTTKSFYPKYTIEGDPKCSVTFTSASIGHNVKTDDPNIKTVSIGQCYFSKEYSTREELIQKGTLWTGSIIMNIKDLERGTTYYFVPMYRFYSINNDRVEFWGDKVYSFTTLSSDLEIGEAVDLGLSVKWRSCNLGATGPYGYGEAYSWGETSEPLSGEKYDKYNKDGGSVILSKEDDSAHYRMGGYWRMPTLEEALELKNNCEITYRSYDSINGIPAHTLIRSKVPGYTDKFIILPNVSFWTSSLDLIYGSHNACMFNFSPNYSYIEHRVVRSNEHYIRPVYCDKEN